MLRNRKEHTQRPGIDLELERRLEDDGLAVDRRSDRAAGQLERESLIDALLPGGGQHPGRGPEVELALVEPLALAEREERSSS